MNWVGVNKNNFIYNCHILNLISVPTLLIENLQNDTDTLERLKCLDRIHIALNVNGSLLLS